MKYLLLIFTIICFINVVSAQEYKGTLAVWGDYTITHSPQSAKGSIFYNNVLNGFIYEKSGKYYTIKGYNQKKEFVSIKYIYNKIAKTLKLASRPSLNPHFFNTTVINNQKNTGKKIAVETDVYKAFGELVYALFKDKYKLKLNANPDNKVAFFVIGSAYIGAVANNEMHGKGIFYNKIETHKGTWENGQKNGHFELTLKKGTAKAYFEKGLREGIWTANAFDGGIKEIVFKNDKEVSSKVIKAAPKREWNKKMIGYYDEFLFQLSDPRKLLSFMTEQAGRIEKAAKNNSDFSFRSLQTMTKPIKYKLKAHFAGINAADDELLKMIDEAEQVACDETLIHVKKIQTELNGMRKFYSKAHHQFNEQQFTKNLKGYENHISKGEDYINDAIKAYNRLVPLVNSFKVFPCYKTAIVNPKRKPVKKKIYQVGLFLSDNETYTEITITGVNSNSVAEKAGIEKGDKLLRINGTYFADMGSRAAHEWLQSTNFDKSYELEYFDISTKSQVTVYLKPSTYEYKVLKTEKLNNYIENSTWGDKKYTGELHLGMPHGKGKITFPNGDVYEGELDQGERTNQGTMRYADGSVYKGGWFKDRKDGKSVFTTAKGVEHHGTYKRGRKHRFFFIVYSDDNIVQDYYGDNGKVLFTKKISLEEAAKHIGRTPKETRLVKKETTKTKTTSTITKDKRVGVGLVIRNAGGGRFSASNTHKGWAAKRAGIYEDTQILEINGQSIKGKPKYEVEGMLKGEKGTYITVKFCPRNKPEKTRVYKLYRGKNGRAELVLNWK